MQFLADTSAWTNAYKDPDAWARWKHRMRRELVHVCSPVILELLRGTRNRTEYRTSRTAFAALANVDVTQSMWDRALEVQSRLEAQGMHRGVTLVDLVVAAAAEQAELVVLHYDKDFDLIAEVTGQPTEWVAPRGSL